MRLDIRATLLQARIVPLIVEHDTFWRRYFYRLHLLKEAHAQRAALAARAAAPPEEEVPPAFRMPR